MKLIHTAFLFGVLLFASAPGSAQESALAFGGDRYASGQNVSVGEAVEHDAFLAGNNVTLNGPVSGDAHLAGFDVNSTAPVDGDVYAVGFSVEVTESVGGDVTAAGNSVTLRSEASVGGNARLAGATVTVAAPIAGAVLVTAQTLVLEAPITGDLNFYGESITFGSSARVDGNIAIRAPNEIEVPASVAPAERVTFTQGTRPDYMQEAGRTAADTVVRRFWPELWVAALGWLALIVIGAALIAFMPRAMNRMQTISERRPFRNIGLGILALASLVGLVPLIALTIIGLLAVPIVLIVVALFCVLGYLLGTYFTGLRIAGAFARVDTNLKRIAVLAASLIVTGLLAMIPIAGWLLVFLLTIFGLGVMAVVLMIRWSARDAERLEITEAAPGA